MWCKNIFNIILNMNLWLLLLWFSEEKVHSGKCNSDNCPFWVFSCMVYCRGPFLHNAVCTDVNEFDCIGYFFPFWDSFLILCHPFPSNVLAWYYPIIDLFDLSIWFSMNWYYNYFPKKLKCQKTISPTGWTIDQKPLQSTNLWQL